MSRQIDNRNFLSPTGFRFTLNRTPKVTYFGNRVNIPGITLGIANQATYLKDIDVPGDKLTFEDLTLNFLIDEDLKNYIEIQNWMRGLGFPESLQEIYDLQKEDEYKDTKLMNIYSDATLIILNSQQNPKLKVEFNDVFPYTLTTLDFDATATDVDYFTAEVSFKYSIYKITSLD